MNIKMRWKQVTNTFMIISSYGEIGPSHTHAVGFHYESYGEISPSHTHAVGFHYETYGEITSSHTHTVGFIMRRMVRWHPTLMMLAFTTRRMVSPYHTHAAGFHCETYGEPISHSCCRLSLRDVW